MRFTLPLIVLLFLITTSLANGLITKTTAHYDITIGDEDAEVLWLLNYSTTARNIRLTLTFNLPENATLLSLGDLHGPITDYDLAPLPGGDEVRLETQNDGQGGPLMLRIRYELKDFAPESYGRLRVSVPLCIAQTDEESTDVTLPADAVLISSTPKAEPGSRRAHFDSVDSCITLVYKRGTAFEGDGGYHHYSTEHYETFAQEITPRMRQEIVDAESLYGMFSEITGLEPPYSKWALVFTPGEGSAKGEAGLYVGTGLFYIREDALEDHLAPLMAHETIHGFNSQPLAWNELGGFWFEEGTATYAAHLFSLELGLEEADFFVKNSNYYSSTYEELADYYRTGNNYMETWDFETLDTFSYDYSQFIIRAYVDFYGTEALRQVYACLPRVPEDAVADPQTRNDYLLGCMSLAAGNASYESILYPLKSLFLTDEHAFGRHVARIGSSSWKGEAKPLPISAYELPPLPYEQEASEALSSLSASMEAAPAFSSPDAQSLFSQAQSEYGQATSLFEAERYQESLAASARADSLLQLALEAEQQYAGQPAIPSLPSGAEGSSCAPASALLALAAFAFARGQT